jgi:type IV secretion system protein VirB10
MAVDPGFDGVTTFRSRPPLTGRQRIWIILVILAIVVFAVALTGLLGGKHKRLDAPTERNISTGIPFQAASEPKPAVEHPVPQKIVAPNIPKTPISFKTPSKDSALDAPMFSATGVGYDGNSGAAGRGASAGPGEKDDEFTASMTASGVGAAAKAHRMKHPSLTVPAGIVIPCILQTAINSELIGFVDCTLPSEVRSADGSTPLLDKGTQVMGQIKSGLRRGQERLFILWTRARTPDNVTVDLASPAADELGRAGVTGAVNTHFWKMFGTAALYSLIEYGPQLATAAIQNMNKGNTSFNNYTTFLQPQQQMANTILQEDLRIPPTLEKNQGDTVSIFVARDLDFSGVYEHRMVGSQVNACNDCQVPTWTTERDLRRNR